MRHRRLSLLHAEARMIAFPGFRGRALLHASRGCFRACSSTPSARCHNLVLRSRGFLNPVAHHRFSTRDFLKKVDDDLVEDGGARGKQRKEAAPNPAILADANATEAAHNKSIIGGYTENGFLVNNVEMEGSCLVLPRSSFLWAPRTFEEITPESLKIIPLIFPSLEILLLGSGDRTRRPDPELAAAFRNQGIVVEQMTTVSAIGTFNILNTEDRRIGAALLHPSADWNETD